jgi:hypothetical protein
LQLPPDVEATELQPVDFVKFALMLLSCGATVKPKCVFRKLTEQFAIVQQKHSQLQQQQISSRARVAAVHVAASWHELGGNSSSTFNSSSRSIVDFMQIQLVHAVTQQREAKLFTIDLKLLAQLYASAVPAAAATADATTATGDSAGSESSTTAGASSAERSMNSTTTVSSTGSSSSGSMMLAVQQECINTDDSNP